MLQNNISLNGKTILVTGAAGFIGSNLVKRLLNDFEPIKVIGIDSITDYYDVNLKQERLKEIEGLSKDWTFIKGNIADKVLIEQVFTENKIDVVVNLAAEEGFSVCQGRLIDNDCGTFCLDALHDTLDG